MLTITSHFYMWQLCNFFLELYNNIMVLYTYTWDCNIRDDFYKLKICVKISQHSN